MLSGEDRTSPRATAALLGDADASGVVRRALAALPDPDGQLAGALALAPAVLAQLFTRESLAAAPGAPIVLAGTPPQLAPWTAAGVTAPLPAFATAAAGIGVASLEEETGGIVRRVPLFGLAGDAVVAGLAIEALRVAQGAGSFIVKGGNVAVGDLHLPLGWDAMLRIRPSGPERWSARTVPAAEVLAGHVATDRLKGRIVLIGGGSPELGALRATAASPVAPSVQIQADALATALSDRIPFRPVWAVGVEVAAFLGLSLAGALAGAFLGPVAAAAASLAGAGLWLSAAVVAVAGRGFVVDPVTPALGGLLAALAASAAAAMWTRRREAAIRRSFEQHLNPAVVARIVAHPDLVRFGGERRNVTALISDIEGFTTLTDRIGPTELIALLDRYFEGVVEIILAHGGMVDKFVGDAVHAFFNAPLDLPDHPRQALAAAHEILAFTRRYAASGAAAAAGLGRTRIGIETGDVVIGDVGLGQKRDYTAYGSAVNTAARLEGLNKQFGTSICVGPLCRAALPDIGFVRLGDVEVRGRGIMTVFTPDAGGGQVADPSPGGVT